MNNHMPGMPGNHLPASNQPTQMQVRQSIVAELANIHKRCSILNRRKRLIEEQRDSRVTFKSEVRNVVYDDNDPSHKTLRDFCEASVDIHAADAAMYSLTIEEMTEEISILDERTRQLGEIFLALNSNIIIPPLGFIPPNLT